jgi:hypothetical protein
MRPSIAVLAFALAGCAMTPGEVLERGTRTQVELKRPPAAAAECIARNAGEISGYTLPEIRGLEAAGREVVVRTASEAGTIAVVQLRPTPAGSSASVYLTPNLLGGDLGGKLLEGC